MQHTVKKFMTNLVIVKTICSWFVTKKELEVKREFLWILLEGKLDQLLVFYNEWKK